MSESLLRKVHRRTQVIKARTHAIPRKTRYISAVVCVVSIVAIGVYLLASSHASTPFVSSETESGNLGGNAEIEHSNSAGNKTYVAFKPNNFKVSGTKIISPSGSTYVPFGVTAYGISQSGWSTKMAGDIAQINASASFWHANMVRIQVAPYFVNNNTAGYLSAVDQEIQTAENDNLNVIISAQYEGTHSLLPVDAPDSTTVQFWKTMAARYAHDNHIWFELFNEPIADKPYSVWRNGGVGTDGKTYVGMQTLVNDIRAVAPHNLIVAETIDDAQHFIGITNYLLTGSNIVYAIHPYFNNISGISPQTLSWWQNQWTTTFGNFAPQLPMMISEWGEHESTNGECQTNAADLVPPFLSYISSLHIGLIGWALTPGAMIHDTNLKDPNDFTPGVPYDCTQNVTGPTSQGAGADLLQFFKDNSVAN